MRILITNDDGISSVALSALAAWASRLGEVTVIAPRVEQSGKSHAIDFHRPLEIKQVPLLDGIEAWSVDSTPADCVRFGVLGLKKRYDLVLSGVNHGYNLGRDIVYSGTVGAIFEAARLDMPGIALSTDFGDPTPALSQLDAVKAYFDERALLRHCTHWNVNIPAAAKGFRFTQQGGIFYTDEFVPQGNDMYQQVGGPVFYETMPPTWDITAVRDGFVSLTPLSSTLTDLALVDRLRSEDQ